MTPRLSLAEWLTATTEVARQTISQTLATESYATEIEGDARTTLPELSGSFLSLVADTDSVQIGLFSNCEGLAAITRAMLGMSPDEDITDPDIADAVGEIVNVIAGGVKSRLNHEVHGMKLGLPMFVSGKVGYGERQEAAMSHLQVGPSPVHLLVMRGKG